ncbi:hypothetical protein [Kitasatospora sp. NPDC001547]|uniref:hypothetical protein n=1 Tax=Kitasatospora sp. NPDC001547 TaxID=3364015 RepID=UPI003674A622
MRVTLADAGVAADLDQIACEFGTASAFCAGRITLKQLQRRTCWGALQQVPARTEPPTDPAAAAAFWAERKPAFAEVNGVRAVRCTLYWIIRLRHARSSADCARFSEVTPEGGGETVWLTGTYWDADGTGPHRPGALAPRADYALIYAEFADTAPTHPLQ